MSTELERGGIFTRIHLKGYLKDLTNQETTTINTKAIQTKDKLSYYIDHEKYTLKFISPTKLILIRNTSEIDSSLYFEESKILPATYTIKENNLSLSIDLRTNKIEINKNYIKISYTVIDSNNDYEYYIEMRE